jgi:hypothetical protein
MSELAALMTQPWVRAFENSTIGRTLYNTGDDTVDLNEVLGNFHDHFNDGTYTFSVGEYSIELSQPMGKGEEIMVVVRTTGGMEFKMELENFIDDGKGYRITDSNLDSKGLIDKRVEDAVNNDMNGDFWTRFYEDMASNANKGKRKKNGGASSESNGMDGGGSGNWFIDFALAMGEALNKMADELKSKVDDVKLTNGQPPFKDAMEIQGLAQQLNFVSQAFMTALNVIGESLKSILTAGGAAR